MSRLIDADELIVIEFGKIKFVPKEFIDDAPTIEPELYTIEMQEASIDEAMKLLRNARPTILPPERKKGKWIDIGSGQECDQCHEIQYGYDSGRKFCANCGAEMREGEMHNE